MEIESVHPMKQLNTGLKVLDLWILAPWGIYFLLDFICCAIYQDFTHVRKAEYHPRLWFMIHSSRYLHLPLQYIISSIIVTDCQNTKKLAVHHLPGMICIGASSGVLTLPWPQKGGVISIWWVHCVKSFVSHRKRYQKDSIQMHIIVFM